VAQTWGSQVCSDKAACAGGLTGRGFCPPGPPQDILIKVTPAVGFPHGTGWEADDRQGDGAGTSANVLALFRVRDGSPAGRAFGSVHDSQARQGHAKKTLDLCDGRSALVAWHVVVRTLDDAGASGDNEAPAVPEPRKLISDAKTFCTEAGFSAFRGTGVYLYGRPSSTQTLSIHHSAAAAGRSLRLRSSSRTRRLLRRSQVWRRSRYR
jgi:hypothetical protein